MFAAIAVAGFFVLVETVLALGGIRPVTVEHDPYVGFSSSLPLFVEQAGDDGEVQLTTAPCKRSLFNAQTFAKNKASNVRRIFSLGGSTTYGRPYADPLSFSGWLRELLPVADPALKWEVINAGGISYASYRLRVLMEELLHYEPDLFLVYTGHNEFLEKRTYKEISAVPRWVTTAGGWASRTRLYAAGQRLLASFRNRGQERAILGAEVDTILGHSVGPKDYFRDDEQRDLVIEHFRFNLNRMVEMVLSAGAEVVFVTPVSNLKDCSPFKSQQREGLDPVSAKRFDTLMVEGRQASETQDWERAAGLLEEARAIDDRHAELHYRSGLVLYQLGRYADSEVELWRAVDEDVCPPRASSLDFHVR